MGKGVETGQEAGDGGDLREYDGQVRRVIAPEHIERNSLFQDHIEMREQVYDDVEKKECEKAAEEYFADAFQDISF